MPTYELSVILRQMTRPETISTLKRTASAILDNGGIIRKIDNFGSRDLPHKTSVHGLVHKIGSHFTVEFDSSPKLIADLKEQFGRDIDIVRRHIFKVTPPEKKECTLHEELLPPAYRKEIIEMMNIGNKEKKRDYPYNSGYSYYPFQK